nr:hypothetical protein Iba_chr13dCG10400 [Ipomoea batatas]
MELMAVSCCRGVVPPLYAMVDLRSIPPSTAAAGFSASPPATAPLPRHHRLILPTADSQPAPSTAFMRNMENPVGYAKEEAIIPGSEMSELLGVRSCIGNAAV